MYGLEIKKNGFVIGKEVIVADREWVDRYIDKRISIDPDLVITVYEEKDMVEFNAIKVHEVSYKTEWTSEKAKGIQPSIDYLAKRLGLE